MRNECNEKRIGTARGIASVLALALVMSAALTACSQSAGQPAVKIVIPDDPAAGDVTISADVSNFTLDTGMSGGQGRLIYYLDAYVPTYYDHSAVSKAGTFAISGDTSYTWSGVTPGEHKFSVQLVDSNSSPLPLPVLDSVTVTVGPPAGQSAVSILNLSDGTTLPPGNITVSVSVAAFIVSRTDMGVVNRDGEGHIIYYLDETPPVDAGVPATTDRSIVSTGLSHLWKNIPEGQHIFSAQLVNNDDTPLDTPVVASVTINVSAQ